MSDRDYGGIKIMLGETPQKARFSYTTFALFEKVSHKLD